MQNGDKKSHFDGAGFQIAVKYGSKIASQIGKTAIQFKTLLHAAAVSLSKKKKKKCKENKQLIELEHFHKILFISEVWQILRFNRLTCVPTGCVFTPSQFLANLKPPEKIHTRCLFLLDRGARRSLFGRKRNQAGQDVGSGDKGKTF